MKRLAIVVLVLLFLMQTAILGYVRFFVPRTPEESNLGIAYSAYVLQEYPRRDQKFAGVCYHLAALAQQQRVTQAQVQAFLQEPTIRKGDCFVYEVSSGSHPHYLIVVPANPDVPDSSVKIMRSNKPGM